MFPDNFSKSVLKKSRDLKEESRKSGGSDSTGRENFDKFL